MLSSDSISPNDSASQWSVVSHNPAISGPSHGPDPRPNATSFANTWDASRYHSSVDPREAEESEDEIEESFLLPKSPGLPRESSSHSVLDGLSTPLDALRASIRSQVSSPSFGTEIQN